MITVCGVATVKGLWTEFDSEELMALRVRYLAGFIAFAAIMSFPSLVRGQALYSYLDEQGVRVFTNIPPSRPVSDMRVTGASASQTPSQSSTFSPAQSFSSPYETIIEKYAAQYNIDPALISSLISAESDFNTKAVSGKGAGGLMQLMPETASRLGVKDVFDPEQNIRGGVQHLRYLLDTFDNDLSLSLAAYNAGENLVQRLGRIPDFKETHDYVRSITKKYGRKEVAYTQEPAARKPATFRWIDENGVLHLQDTPPVERSESVLSSLTSSSYRDP
jgi:hypothetical protein